MKMIFHRSLVIYQCTKSVKSKDNFDTEPKPFSLIKRLKRFIEQTSPYLRPTMKKDCRSIDTGHEAPLMNSSLVWLTAGNAGPWPIVWKKSSQFEPESLGTESCIHLTILGWELSVKLDRNAVGEWHKLTLCHFIYNEVVSFSCRLTRKTSAIIRNPTFTFILLN